LQLIHRARRQDLDQASFTLGQGARSIACDDWHCDEYRLGTGGELATISSWGTKMRFGDHCIRSGKSCQRGVCLWTNAAVFDFDAKVLDGHRAGQKRLLISDLEEVKITVTRGGVAPHIRGRAIVGHPAGKRTSWISMKISSSRLSKCGSGGLPLIV